MKKTPPLLKINGQPTVLKIMAMVVEAGMKITKQKKKKRTKEKEYGELGPTIPKISFSKNRMTEHSKIYG